MQRLGRLGQDCHKPALAWTVVTRHASPGPFDSLGSLGMLPSLSRLSLHTSAARPAPLPAAALEELKAALLDELTSIGGAQSPRLSAPPLPRPSQMPLPRGAPWQGHAHLKSFAERLAVDPDGLETHPQDFRDLLRDAGVGASDVDSVFRYARHFWRVLRGYYRTGRASGWNHAGGSIFTREGVPPRGWRKKKPRA